MAKLLLPYAYNSKGELIYIESASKGEKYTCPNPDCGAELSLKISRIPEGQKGYKRSHFAHKGNSDNNCSESFLHKLFKERTADFIKKKLSGKEELFFKWKCNKCNEEHSGNLLKKAVKVVIEHDMGICRPDIALLDENNRVVIVIEIVVSHKPEPETLKFYDENKIVYLQVFVKDFEDCNRIGSKLSYPDDVNKCPNPVCNRCGHIMNKAKIAAVVTDCWKCGEKMKVAMIVDESGREILSPVSFNDKEINIAKDLGANIKQVFSKTVKDSYYANVCDRCNAFVGDFYMHEYYELLHDKEFDLGYKCFCCLREEEFKKQQAKLEENRKKAEKFNELIFKNGDKKCPRCGGILKVRTGQKGHFMDVQTILIVNTLKI